jgi:hypothetical protein
VSVLTLWVPARLIMLGYRHRKLLARVRTPAPRVAALPLDQSAQDVSAFGAGHLKAGARTQPRERQNGDERA